MTTKSPARRRPSFIKLLLTCALIGVVMGAAGGLADGLGLTVPLIVSSAAVLILGVLILWLSARWWVGVDEAVREAHKFSWFWGGSAGMIVVGAVAQELAHQVREQCRITPGAHGEVPCGELGARRAARVDHPQAGPARDAAQHAHRVDQRARVSVRHDWIGADQDGEAGVVDVERREEPRAAGEEL